MRVQRSLTAPAQQFYTLGVEDHSGWPVTWMVSGRMRRDGSASFTLEEALQSAFALDIVSWLPAQTLQLSGLDLSALGHRRPPEAQSPGCCRSSGPSAASPGLLCANVLSAGPHPTLRAATASQSWELSVFVYLVLQLLLQ